MAGQYLHREVYEATVTSIADPEKRGRLKVTCGAITAEGMDLPDWVEMSSTPYSGRGDAGMFFLPDPGEVVEIEAVVGSSDDDVPGLGLLAAPDYRWRCCIYPDTASVPAEFRAKYGKRMGIKTPSGQILMFDEALKEVILKAGKLRLLSEAADEPIPLGNVLLAFLSSFLDQYMAHTHATGVGPSGPPLTAAQTAALKANNLTNKAILSDAAFVQKGGGI